MQIDARTGWHIFVPYNPLWHMQSRRVVSNIEQALALEEEMFQWRSRFLVLVITVGYKEEHRPFKTVDDMAVDRDRFFNNQRSNRLLMGILGCIWKIEEGGHMGGIHMHLVIFYDGSHRADVQIAESIGEYWVCVITRGEGSYWNSNADKERNAAGPYGDATGQIDRHNYPKRQSLRWLLEDYICKPEQKVSSYGNPHRHLFGTTQVPI